MKTFAKSGCLTLILAALFGGCAYGLIWITGREYFSEVLGLLALVGFVAYVVGVASGWFMAAWGFKSGANAVNDGIANYTRAQSNFGQLGRGLMGLVRDSQAPMTINQQPNGPPVYPPLQRYLGDGEEN